MRRLACIVIALSAACGESSPQVRMVAPPLPTASGSQTAQSRDVLGPKPEVPAPPPFVPPAPVVYASTNGLTVWLLERHSVPLVSMTLTVPTGAAADPKGKGGLARATAMMLDEGAGKLGAIELTRAIEALGASLSTTSDADASFVSLTVLKRNLPAAFSIFGDVVARPSFLPREWQRVHDLWLNDLKARASDPDRTARVVYRSALFGPDHPYGHPWDGTMASAKAIELADVKSFYGAAFRPDRASLVVVGDVTKEELSKLIEGSFATWKPPAGAAPAVVTPAALPASRSRFVLVDRPDAPQSIIAVVRPGLAASDPDIAPLVRVNTAIGGSFTSRLNLDLREEHGWSYGARSLFSMSRGPGQVISSAAVITDKTGDALQAMMSDLGAFAKDGLTAEEVDKTRSQARADLVSTYESTESMAERLAANAALGLGANYDADASVRRDKASAKELNGLAARYYQPTDAIVVVVGPRAKVQPMLKFLPAPEVYDADGAPVQPK